MKEVAGRAVDSNGVEISEMCVGLFTEKGHRLIAQMATDNKGRFKFKGMSNGRYRLVARVPGYDYFCPINAKLRINKDRKKNPRVILRMVPPGIDRCSWAETQ